MRANIIFFLLCFFGGLRGGMWCVAQGMDSLSQNNQTQELPHSQDSVLPLLPGGESSEQTYTKPPPWSRPSLDTLRKRMIGAEKFGKDSSSFESKILRYKDGYHQYQIWLYPSNMIVRHKYTKDCNKKSITKDCFWEEIDIPYRFIDSIRSVLYSPGYVIHYHNLQVQRAKFKLLIGLPEVNYVAKIIKDEAKRRGVKLDSNFAKVYHKSWKDRVDVMLNLLNKMGLKMLNKSPSSPSKKNSQTPLKKIKAPKISIQKSKKDTPPIPTTPNAKRKEATNDTSAPPKEKNSVEKPLEKKPPEK